jgi:peptide/nickel transport system substrate-binding protein
MRRRRFLGAAAGALLVRPAMAVPADRVLRFVPDSNLATIDPVWNITPVTRNHGMMVWDMLYGRDAGFVPRPQMVARHEVSEDQLRWRFMLRDGLVFHDGTPVRSADCIASIRRWATRRPLGQRLLARASDMTVLDDKRFDIVLRAPFPQMTLALSEFCYIMPERIARTDPNTRITEVVGSGPFRFVAGEWESGARVVYTKFDRYQPRPEPPSFMAGGKVAWFERVEWQILPDSATAVDALLKGEVDWVQQPQFDLLPLLRANLAVRVVSNDKIGVMGMLALNHLHPPFDDPAIRRAVLSAVSQRDFMEAAVGDDASMYRVPIGVFTPNMAMANTAGMDALTGPRDLDRSRRMVKDTGYKGEPVVVMGAVDSPVTFAMAQVAVDLFQKLGMTVDFVSLDLGTLVQRRANKGPSGQGGWDAFTTTYEGLTMEDPATNVGLRGNGGDAWYGWPTSPALESLRETWFEAPDEKAEAAIAEQIQTAALTEVPFIPLGQLFWPTATRSNLEGLIPSPFPIFWNIRRTGSG